MKTRRKFNAAFKAQVAITALRERESIAELSKKYDVHPNMISKWKQEFMENASAAFGANPIKADEPDNDKLYAKIGRLELENDFLKKSLRKTGLL